MITKINEFELSINENNTTISVDMKQLIIDMKNAISQTNDIDKQAESCAVVAHKFALMKARKLGVKM